MEPGWQAARSPAPACVLSFAIRSGQYMSQALLLENALAYTTTAPLLVHVSACEHGFTDLQLRQTMVDFAINSGAALRRAKLRLLRRDLLANDSSRVHFNPTRLCVDKHSPSILRAHLANFELCSQPGMPCSGESGSQVRFVMLASNQVLLRSGIEAWVTRHSMSFCPGDVCTDLFGALRWNESTDGLFTWPHELQQVAWGRVRPDVPMTPPHRRSGGGNAHKRASISAATSTAPPGTANVGYSSAAAASTTILAPGPLALRWFAPFVQLLGLSRNGQIERPPTVEWLQAREWVGRRGVGWLGARQLQARAKGSPGTHDR